MKLYYFKDPEHNYGDDLNPWIWDRMLPDFFDNNADSLFVGIGTLLNHRIPKAKRYIVFGSGVGYGDMIDKTNSWDFICVRGPKSAHALDLDSEIGVVDPAIFINKLFPYQEFKKSIDVSFIPAGRTAIEGNWQKICQMTGINFIDPRDNVEKIMTDIAKSKLILAEAMHGAISAEAFRIPWIAVQCSNYINEWKWEDFCESLSLQYSPSKLKPLYRGFHNLKVKDRYKAQIKRILRELGIWRHSWDEPLPNKSSERECNNAANRILQIVGQTQPCLSDNKVFYEKLEEIESLLVYAQKKYS